MHRDLPPVIALDVDGVLAPWLKPEYGEMLAPLAEHGELVWATSWEHMANQHVSLAVGLPRLPVIEFPQIVKLPAVRAWCGECPVAWIDDFFGPEADEWATGRSVPTLLVKVDGAHGLQPTHVDRVAAWLELVSSDCRRPRG